MNGSHRHADAGTTRRDIPLVDMAAVNAPYLAELRIAFERVLATSDFGSGEQVTAFEAELGSATGADHVAGVSSGTSALSLSFAAAGVGAGDEVLLPANTFFATASAAVAVGATPVAVEIDTETGLIDLDAAEAAVTARTAVLAVVHLYGNPVDMDRAASLASKHGLLLVEDAAQALGGSWRGTPVGSLADVSTFSFYPTKTLGALGQAGAVCTRHEDIARRIVERREQGQTGRNRHEVWGGNERLDGMQAAFLRIKLAHLPDAQAQRREAAAVYDQLLHGQQSVERFRVDPLGVHAHHLYAVRVEDRDVVADRMRVAGVATGVHYPVPVHRQPVWPTASSVPALPRAERHAATTLSLPFWPGIDPSEIARVVETLSTATASIHDREIAS